MHNVSQAHKRFRTHQTYDESVTQHTTLTRITAHKMSASMLVEAHEPVHGYTEGSKADCAYAHGHQPTCTHLAMRNVHRDRHCHARR